jgi:sulfonate transport system substrate-binding protein
MSHPPARTRRTLTAAAASVIMLGVLAGCGSDAADAGESGKPVLRVGVQKDGIRSVLTEAGLLEDLPYKIEWSEFTAGPPIIEAAAADQIDVAWVGSAPPIFGAAADAAFKVVATVETRDKKQDSIVVPKGSDVTSVADLKGKKVAVAKGTSGQGHLLLALEDAGLTLADVKPQYLAPADGLAAFQSGEVDAWSTWEPFVTQVVQEDGAVNITADQGATTDPYLQFEIASAASLEEKGTRTSIRHFVGLLDEAFTWAVDNPDKWGEGWAKESGLPTSTTIAVATSKAADVVPVSKKHIASEQRLADTFFKAGEIPVKINFADLVEPGLIK